MVKISPEKKYFVKLDRSPVQILVSGDKLHGQKGKLMLDVGGEGLAARALQKDAIEDEEGRSVRRIVKIEEVQE
ncbi:MAG TPA: hypothetical protein VF189_06910 [Patescibacteria group bacterium]